MSVSREDVLRVAALAELAVPPEDLPELTVQMDRIVEFVARLTALGGLSPGHDTPAAQPDTPLREDVVAAADLARGPAGFAPEFTDGFFIVPKLGAMEDS